MSRALTFAVVAVLLCAGANAIAIKWTGYGGDNQWTNRLNWSPDQVPGTNDDVTIDSGTVLVTIPTGCNSLVMGTQVAAPANVTFFNSFYVGSGGLECDLNGNIFINSGAANVASSGTITIGGGLFFQSGQIGGQWTIANRGSADLSGPAQKTLSGASLVVQGTFVLQGVLVLNMSSQLSVTSTAVLSKDVSIQSQDTTTVLFDTSKGTLNYNGGGTFQIQAPVSIGTFNFVAGNLSVYNALTFANPFVIPSGSFVNTVGSAVVDMSAGVSGTGVLSAAGVSLVVGNANLTGPLNLIGGNLSIKGTSASFALFTITGGNVFFHTATQVGQLNLMNGNLYGSGGVSAAQLLLNCPGLNLQTSITITGHGTNTAKSLFSFGTGASVRVASGATYHAQGVLSVVGTSGTFTNNGILNVGAPVTFQNINLMGSGSVTATSTLTVNTATVGQNNVNLSGGGMFKGQTTVISSISAVACNPSVDATFGSYSVTCAKECTGISTATQPSSPFAFSCGSSRVRLL